MVSLQEIQWYQRRRIRTALSRIFAYIIMILVGTMLLLPFIWMVSLSLKDNNALAKIPPEFFSFPLHFENYVHAWQRAPFGRFIMNSIKIILGNIFGQLITATIVAFGFARIRFPGRNILFFILLASMMLPPQVTMVSRFIIWTKLGTYNTYIPLILPAWLGGAATYVFLFRQFFLTIPLELDDSAKIDGCNLFQIYLKMILPLSAPVLGIIAIFTFQSHWNDYLSPLLYLQSTLKYTFAVGLTWFRSQLDQTTRWNHLMAMATVQALPPIIIFFIAQKYFIQGVVITGVKG